MRVSTRTLRLAATSVAAVAVLVACDRSDDDLWKREYPAPRPATAGATDLTGIWQGSVAMGAIRLRIESERLTLAMRCDADAKKVAQATAGIRLDRDGTPRLVLQDDLAGGDEDCGFRFAKGAEFRVAIDARGALQIGFAGDGVSRLDRLADLPTR